MPVGSKLSGIVWRKNYHSYRKENSATCFFKHTVVKKNAIKVAVKINMSVYIALYTRKKHKNQNPPLTFFEIRVHGPFLQRLIKAFAGMQFAESKLIPTLRTDS